MCFEAQCNPIKRTKLTTCIQSELLIKAPGVTNDRVERKLNAIAMFEKNNQLMCNQFARTIIEKCYGGKDWNKTDVGKTVKQLVNCLNLHKQADTRHVQLSLLTQS